MGLPVFQFRLTHANLGTRIVSEPDGWKDAKLKLERHPDFHQLVEYFEGGFIHYGENNVDIGGADFIRQCENLYGFNTDITEEIDVSFDGVLYENIFTGLKDLTGLQEVQDNKIEVPTIPDTLWSKFIARLETPVNLRSTVDLDGNAISPVEPVDINLPSQKIRQKYQANYTGDEDPLEGVRQYVIPAGQYGIIDFESAVIDEIDERFRYINASDPAIPFEMFAMKFAGTYTFEIILNASTTPLSILGSQVNDVVAWFQINNESPISITKTASGVDGINGASNFYYNAVHELKENDQVRVYYENPGAVQRTFYTSGASNITVIGDTIYPSTESKGFYLHDVFAGIVERIVGTNSFYSEVFGRTDTNMRQYLANGCYSPFIILKGLHIRGFTLEEKIFSISFDKAWKIANPIFNLSLGKETISSVDYIRLEKKERGYNATSTSVFIENIRTISREYDPSVIFNSLQFGFNKGNSEETSGNDDIHGKREYANILTKLKNKLTQYSDGIAASTAIEVTRRQQLEKDKNKDYKFDDDDFIIHVKDEVLSPDRYEPETDENFDSITGILNSDTRYNTILSPTRSMLRWGNVWNGCLQKYQNTTLRFVAGEKNYDAITDYSCGSGEQCLAVICDPLSEKGDINLSVYGGGFGYLHLPLLYTIEIINFSWDDYTAIRDNPNISIALSQTLDNFKRFFIKELTYEICKSKCKIVAWPYDETPILVIDTDIPEREFEDPFEEDCGDRVRLLEDGDERITEDGECRNLEDGNTNFFYQESEAIPFYMYQESEATETYFYQQSEL